MIFRNAFLSLGGTALSSYIQSIEPSFDTEMQDDTAMGDTWESHIAGSGIKSWSANCDVHWDEGDTNGQLAATLGASLTLNLYPEGSTTGDVYYTGTASVVRRGITVEKDGRTIEMGIEFRGNRELASATV
jgi:hypothetical protein